MTPETLVEVAAVGAALVAAGILIWYLIAKPSFTRGTLVLLFFGLGVFPITAATLGNVKGYEETKQVDFCGGCHVMGPWISDVRNTEATSLAALHGRSDLLKDKACYECHADYGMYGAVMTKVQGTQHMYSYWMHGFSGMEATEAIPKIHLFETFPNGNCMHCHSTRLPGFTDEPEHMAVLEDVRTNQVSCASDGCHGPAHGVKAAAGEKTAEAP